jgi:hypothetical protein
LETADRGGNPVASLRDSSGSEAMQRQGHAAAESATASRVSLNAGALESMRVPGVMNKHTKTNVYEAGTQSESKSFRKVRMK